MNALDVLARVSRSRVRLAVRQTLFGGAVGGGQGDVCECIVVWRTKIARVHT